MRGAGEHGALGGVGVVAQRLDDLGAEARARPGDVDALEPERDAGAVDERIEVQIDLVVTAQQQAVVPLALEALAEERTGSGDK